MGQDNASTVRAIEETWDRGALDELNQYFAEDFDNSRSAVPGLPTGLAGSKTAHQGVMQSFQDRKVEILELISERDRVFVRNRVAGTNTGGFPAFQVPPNSRPFDIESWGVYRLRDGKVVAHVGMNDAIALLMQIGGFPGQS